MKYGFIALNGEIVTFENEGIKLDEVKDVLTQKIISYIVTVEKYNYDNNRTAPYECTISHETYEALEKHINDYVTNYEKETLALMEESFGKH